LCADTSQEDLENAFKKFTTNDDISVLLISQVWHCALSLCQLGRCRMLSLEGRAHGLYILQAACTVDQDVAAGIRWLIDDFEAPVPAILEVTSCSSVPVDLSTGQVTRIAGVVVQIASADLTRVQRGLLAPVACL
jgi:vacuolar-type H+-ATPase subunit F/Vma7